jgi:hypothetical protein
MISSFVKSPAVSFPSATTHAPVSVAKSINYLGLNSFWTYVKVSAKTSLPSASVFPISTVKPLILFIISPGRYERFPIEFSAKLQAKIIFFLIYSSIVPFNAPITAHDPPLSPYISSIDPVGFIFKPPVSKVMPLPTKAISIWSDCSGFPS